MALHTYPDSLRTSGNQAWVSIVGRGTGGGAGVGASFALYAPSSFSVSDGANYQNMDYAIAGLIDESMQGASSDEIAQNLTNSTKIGQDQRADKALMAAIIGKVSGSSMATTAGAAIMRKQRTALNPNTVLQYTGPLIRSFQLQFNLVARSSTEAETIKTMINTFRAAMYPEANGFIYKYPDVFQVNFMYGKSYNTHVPRFAESFLQDMNIQINNNSNMYHKDGAPTDITLALTFREFKTLSRQDIQSLAGGGVISEDNLGIN